MSEKTKKGGISTMLTRDRQEGRTISTIALAPRHLKG